MPVRVSGGEGMPRRRPLEIEDGPESLTFDRILKPSDADAPGGEKKSKLAVIPCIMHQKVEIVGPWLLEGQPPQHPTDPLSAPRTPQRPTEPLSAPRTPSDGCARKIPS